MGKLFNLTTIVSVMIAMLVYFMVVAPMMAKPTAPAPANGNGNGNGGS
tara:strand:- start:543 stop:686 length:144 start_codon:yes stop_codon:yes gene_type:complete